MRELEYETLTAPSIRENPRLVAWKQDGGSPKEALRISALRKASLRIRRSEGKLRGGGLVRPRLLRFFIGFPDLGGALDI